MGLTVYQGESRALKWLNGLDLPAPEQRLVLSSAGSYDITRLLLSVELHCAGHPPPTQTRGQEMGKAKGKGGKRAALQVHVTQTFSSSGAEPTSPEAIHESRGSEEGCELEEVAEALSVTAQRLKHLTLSRGWVPPANKGKGKNKTIPAPSPT